jgi:hypothetical protein
MLMNKENRTKRTLKQVVIVTNSAILVTGHCYQNKTFKETKNHRKVNLDEESFVSISMILCLGIHQHLWGCNTAQADIIKGQITKKEVHGWCGCGN